MEQAVNPELVVLFFLIAFLYSSVGFGGGSSYLAILTLFGIEFKALRIIALLCNIIVVSSGVALYWRNGLIKWKKVTPLLMFSIPAAFIGGYLKITAEVFFVVLGFTLVAAAALMWVNIQNANEESEENRYSGFFSAFLGGGAGFLAGLVGIGGGIFLSPALHLMKWDKARIISATASFFILVNSISGLFGQLQNPAFFSLDMPFILPLLGAVFLGGFLGTRAGIHIFKPLVIIRLTSFLVFYVGAGILFKYIPLLNC